MLAANSITNVETWYYEKIKGYLLLKNAGYNDLIYLLREKHGLLDLDWETRNEKIVISSLYTSNPLMDDVRNIADKLALPYRFIEKSAAWDNITENLIEELIAPVEIPSGNYVLREGFFIRVGPDTTKYAVLTALKQLQDEIRNLNRYIDPPQKAYNPPERDKSSYNLAIKIQCYCIMEEILYNEEQPQNKIFLKDKIIITAMAKAIEDKRLLKFFSDRKSQNPNFDEMQFLNHAYRDLQRQYKIPSYSKFVNSHIRTFLHPTH